MSTRKRLETQQQSSLNPAQAHHEFHCDPINDSVNDSIHELAERGSLERRGAIFTRIEVVEFILDIAGYTGTQPLQQKRLLEPSFGNGDFLIASIKRLLTAWRNTGKTHSPIKDLGNAIRAVELHRQTFSTTHKAVLELLIKEGIEAKIASLLTSQWLSQDDFLLAPIEGQFDFVIGNPPYVRQELIPAPLLAEYRHRYQTIYDRADLYVPFIERSLSLLNEGGSLGFICANRWMKNRYGGPLRSFISQKFRLKIYVDMMSASAFHSQVSAYPAITIISREAPGPTRIAHCSTVTRPALSKLANILDKIPLRKGNNLVREVAQITNGSEPWLIESAAQVSLLRRLERELPALEEAGCRVGIGVATGADKVFIGNFEELDVEQDRKLPLATTKDIASGQVIWQGKGVINPFAEEGGLVSLKNYPRLRRYIESHKKVIANRHCAKKSPNSWYRTIDKITPSLADRPKLLIPDIKGSAHIVFESGKLYPHHNLYYITSDEWELRALQAVLLSDISRLFIAMYSTKMRGGFLRFQAQYLRRICIPLWAKVSQKLRRELTEAALAWDLAKCNRAAFKLYGLSREEKIALDSGNA